MTVKKRTEVPAVAPEATAGGLVDALTQDAAPVELPTGRLERHDAEKLTERIRLTATTARERLTKLAQLVEAAKAGEAWSVLEFPSWTAYLADVLGGQLELASAERREVVAVLSGEGMSTSAIASVTGTSKATAARDVAATRDQVSHPETPAKVTGVDGKTYAAPTVRQQPAPMWDEPTLDGTPAPTPERHQWPTRPSMVDDQLDRQIDLDLFLTNGARTWVAEQACKAYQDAIYVATFSDSGKPKATTAVMRLRALEHAAAEAGYSLANRVATGMSSKHRDYAVAEADLVIAIHVKCHRGVS